MTDFVHLRLHTAYSVTSSVVRIDALMSLLGDRSAGSVAVSDVDNLFASFKFSASALKRGIKPILGADVSVTTGDQSDIQGGTVTLLICNRDGYQNLCRLITLAYEARRERRRTGGAEPVVGIDVLRQYSQGLIALSAGQDGFIGQCLGEGREEQALGRVQTLLDCFGDRFYLSIERIWEHDAEKYHTEFCVVHGQRLGVPVVATNNVEFLEPGDYLAHTIRVGIHENLNVNDKSLQNKYSQEQYLKSAQQMSELFADLPESISNSVEISRRCNYFLTESKRPFLPDLEIPGAQSAEEHLAQRSRTLLETMLKEDKRTRAESELYRSRLEMELSIIIKMGFAAYFLIVDEFVNWARANRVVVGPGRGSGPGSLVARVLGITRVDPIRHDLLFERFLNPERVSLPDFDIDFDDHRRDLVIAHVAEKYGREKVSQIITFGTMAARAAVRDVGRVTGRPYGQVDRIARLIPFAVDMTLELALESSEFSAEYKNPETRDIIDRAREIEGLPRNPGRHAGGVVIAPTTLSDFCPLYYGDEGVSLTQFDKDDLEAIGLVKYDFLGLRVLSTIRDALANIERAGGGKIDIEKIDLQDRKTLDLINEEKTLGVFQLESAGMRELIRKLRPDSFNDIVALVALFRPGPMEARVHDTYCDRKHGVEETSYYHHSLEPVLKPTYGVFIYQEQVMQAARVMAGYSLGDADLLRRAIGKKKPEELARQKPVFVAGCAKNNISEKTAEEVFELLSFFGGYGFNKSHSVSYGLLAFQTAWLKSHHPAAYMAALMSNEPNHDNIARMVRDCGSTNIKVLPPDINRSNPGFVVLDEHRILYGLGRIKGVGATSRYGLSFVEQVCKERGNAGDFTSFTDFLVRVPLDKCNSKTLTALIGSGACDSLVGRTEKSDRLTMRLTMIDAVERNILEFAQGRRAALESGQGGLFAGGSADAGVDEFEYHPQADDKRKALACEYEALNLYLGEHPVGLVRQGSPELAKLPRLAGLRKQSNSAWCLLEIRDIATSRRANQLTISCDDENSNQILFFPHERIAASVRSPWSCKTKIVLAKIKCASTRVQIHNLYLESDMREHLCWRIEIDLRCKESAECVAALTTVNAALTQAQPGRTSVRFHYHCAESTGSFDLPRSILLDEEVYKTLLGHPAFSGHRLRYALK